MFLPDASSILVLTWASNALAGAGAPHFCGRTRACPHNLYLEYPAEVSPYREGPVVRKNPDISFSLYKPLAMRTFLSFACYYKPFAVEAPPRNMPTGQLQGNLSSFGSASSLKFVRVRTTSGAFARPSTAGCAAGLHSAQLFAILLPRGIHSDGTVAVFFRA